MKLRGYASTSSKSTFSPNTLSPMYITTTPTGTEMNQGIPKPAGM